MDYVSTRKAINRNWSNQKPHLTLKTKKINNLKNTNRPKYNENKWPIEWAAIFQKVSTQHPKQNCKNDEQTYGESSPKL